MRAEAKLFVKLQFTNSAWICGGFTAARVLGSPGHVLPVIVQRSIESFP